MRWAYWWRTPPLAMAVEPEQMPSRSSTITRPYLPASKVIRSGRAHDAGSDDDHVRGWRCRGESYRSALVVGHVVRVVGTSSRANRRREREEVGAVDLEPAAPRCEAPTSTACGRRGHVARRCECMLGEGEHRANAAHLLRPTSRVPEASWARWRPRTCTLGMKPIRARCRAVPARRRTCRESPWSSCTDRCVRARSSNA